MNEEIIKRWNTQVGRFDKVFYLGDFCFGRHNIEIAGRLNGQKRLILGNHDVYDVAEYLKYFLSIHGVLFWQECILTHVPVHPNQLEHRSKINVHGHLHSKIIDNPKYINVSCEQNNLTPIHESFIIKSLQELR